MDSYSGRWDIGISWGIGQTQVLVGRLEEMMEESLCQLCERWEG